LAHGTEDDRVPVQVARHSATSLQSLGLHVSWHEYEGLGHWYSAPMLSDLAVFLTEKVGWNKH
jgi:predicted esterase